MKSFFWPNIKPKMKWLMVISITAGALAFAMSQKRPSGSDSKLGAKMSDSSYKKIGHLNAKQMAVTQECATERAFDNEYWNHKEPGIYVDIVSGKPLFASTDKFDSGTGWPSFTKPVDEKAVIEKEDRSHGMVRTEVKSKDADSHLGHVFNDGPGPTKKRYCINSASLRFIHLLNLERDGYAKYVDLFPKPLFESEKKDRAEKIKNGTYARAVLAGGCFWGVEDLFRRRFGVLETMVGYTGGLTENPKYEDVKKGSTGHAEAVEVIFNPKQISYDDLLDFFFTLHDPTTKNRQGNDIGSQYRSAIFYQNDGQKIAAEKAIKRWNDSKKWKAPIVTEIVPAGKFFSAEDYHRDYLVKNPNGYTCHYLREF